MNPIKVHITALIEKYEARVARLSNTAILTYRAEGSDDELTEIIADLKCVLNAVDA